MSIIPYFNPIMPHPMPKSNKAYASILSVVVKSFKESLIVIGNQNCKIVPKMTPMRFKKVLKLGITKAIMNKIRVTTNLKIIH